MTYTPRIAAPDDYQAFTRLVTAHLLELRGLGSEVQITERTLGFWQDLFYLFARPCVLPVGALVSGVEGAIVMVDDIAFSIAGRTGHSFVDTDFGKTAQGYGTYVDPEHRGRGLSRLLRDRMRVELKARGFETIVGGVHLNNAGGAASLKDSAFTWYQLVGFERL